MEKLPHLEGENEDYDGGPWAYAQDHLRTPRFRKVEERWVIAPQLGSKAPAICIFPRRRSTQIRFSPTINLDFAAAYTPICARFDKVFLTDVDKLGNMPVYGQLQHWTATFRIKGCYGTNVATVRVRVNESGDQLLGWAAVFPDTDFAIEFTNFPPPPASAVGFDSSTAVVVNNQFREFDAQQIVPQFSVLDTAVEYETRVKRGQSAWELFALDAVARSNATVESINYLRMRVYGKWFEERFPEHADFWKVDPNTAPD